MRRLCSLWFAKDTKTLNIDWWRGIRKENKRRYPNDPDINTKMQWGIHTNGAKKNSLDSCLDWTLDLGHLSINYIDWTYNKRYRQKHITSRRL